jgi:hypothetical protein
MATLCVFEHPPRNGCRAVRLLSATLRLQCAHALSRRRHLPGVQQTLYHGEHKLVFLIGVSFQEIPRGAGQPSQPARRLRIQAVGFVRGVKQLAKLPQTAAQEVVSLQVVVGFPAKELAEDVYARRALRHYPEDFGEETFLFLAKVQ